MKRLIQKRSNFVAENQYIDCLTLKRKHYEKGFIRCDGYDRHWFHIVW